MVASTAAPAAAEALRRMKRTGLVYDETREAKRWIFPSLPDWRIAPGQGPREWRWRQAGVGSSTGISGFGPATDAGPGLYEPERIAAATLGPRTLASHKQTKKP